MELDDTINGMISDDYKERFIAEYQQIAIRCNKLDNLIRLYKSRELEFTLNCSIDLLTSQLCAMKEYKELLEIRADIEGINIEEVYL